MQVHPGQPLSWKSKRTSVPPPAGNRSDPPPGGLWSMSTGFRLVASIAAMQRAFNPQSTGQHRGDSPYLWKLNRTSVPGPPRKRIVRLGAWGASPPASAISRRLGRAVMHSSCKRDQTGAAPVVGSISSPVAQLAERPTLDREVDGANPSGAATFKMLP